MIGQNVLFDGLTLLLTHAIMATAVGTHGHGTIAASFNAHGDLGVIQAVPAGNHADSGLTTADFMVRNKPETHQAAVVQRDDNANAVRQQRGEGSQAAYVETNRKAVMKRQTRRIKADDSQTKDEEEDAPVGAANAEKRKAPAEPPSENLEAALAKTFGETQMRSAACFFAIFLVCVVIFEYTHRRYAELDFEAPFVTIDEIEAEQNRGPGFWGTIRGACNLWTCYMYKVPEKAVVFVTLSLLMLALVQFANTMLVAWSNAFWDKIQTWGEGDNRKMVPDFQALLLKFLFIAFLYIFAAAYQSYLLSMFQIQVRAQVTDRYTNLWLKSGAYYRLELAKGTPDGVDNPDQRIQADSDDFVSQSLGLVSGFVNTVVQFCLFSHTVWLMSPKDAFGVQGLRIPGWLFWCCLVWSLLVTLCVWKIGWRLKAISAAQQRAEADFRFELTTVRLYAEPIVMSRSEDVHEELIADRFDMVQRCVWENMGVSKRYSMCMSFFSQTQTIFVLLALGNSFLQGKLTLGKMMSADRAMGLINDALMWFPSTYGDILGFVATTDRLLALEQSIAKNIRANESSGAEMGGGGGGADIKKSFDASGLKIENLSVWVPNERQNAEPDDLPDDDPLLLHDAEEPAVDSKPRVVLKDLNLNFEPGARVLLAGPSGAGKSSLIRALSGAWPHATGTVTLPGGKCDSMFFATDVFIPRRSVKAAIAYPRLEEEVEDDAVIRVLELMKLDRLLNVGLNAVQDWNHILSHGEKARVQLARLTLHKPQLAVLDEPLAHLHESMRAPLLGVAFGALPVGATVLVISHELSKDILSLFNGRYDMDIDGKTIVKQ